MSLLERFRTQQAREFDEALARGLPPFPRPVSQCNAFNATPYVVSMARFVETYGNSPRRSGLLDALRDLLSDAESAGVKMQAMLVGGSFLVPAQAAPRDLDAVLFYTLDADATESGQALLALRERALQQKVDVRFVPYDADPIVTLKACAFFSLLYSRTRQSAEISRGVVLIHP